MLVHGRQKFHDPLLFADRLHDLFHYRLLKDLHPIAHGRERHPGQVGDFLKRHLVLPKEDQPRVPQR
jgi:hypothetical protein